MYIRWGSLSVESRIIPSDPEELVLFNRLFGERKILYFIKSFYGSALAVGAARGDRRARASIERK